MNKGALQAGPCAAFCQLSITFPAPAWQTNARPDDVIRSALFGWGLYLYYMMAADADSIWGQAQSKLEPTRLSKNYLKVPVSVGGKGVVQRQNRLGMCLCVDWALLKDAQLENKTCIQQQRSQTPSKGLTGSQSHSEEAVLTLADAQMGIQLMPIKLEISRENLQRPKYA